MNNFIQLNSFPYGQPIWINKEKIVAIWRAETKECSGISTVEDDSWDVTQTVAEILQKINEA